MFRKAIESKLTKVFVSMLIFMQLFFGYTPTTSHAITILDVNFEEMNFGTPILDSGTDKELNAVYLYENVFTKDSIQVDAKVTIVEKNNATLRKFDGTNNPKRFEPIINSGIGGGYFNFRFDFIDSSTNNPVLIKNFYLTGVDIDGGTEYHEISGFASYTVDASTGLTIGNGSSGRTLFDGIGYSLSGVSFEDIAAYIANYTSPISSMNIVLGNKTEVTGSGLRLFSLNFGNPGGAFTTPMETGNSSKPIITVNIGDVDGYLDESDTMTVVPITGTTDAGSGKTVNISVSDGTTALYSTATVQGDNTYSATMDFSTFISGTLTATANVTDDNGNPADPATDTSIKNPVVTFDKNTGDVDASPTNMSVDYGESVGTLPTEPTKAGYSFTGWNTAANGSGTAFESTTAVTGDITVYALWNANDAPVANDGNLTTTEDTAKNGTLSASDGNGDNLTYSIVGSPSKGNVIITDDSTGAYTYTPNSNENGTDSFTFKVNDGAVDSNTATVTITINSTNDAPVANDDSASVDEDSNVIVDVLSNDIDADLDELSIILISTPEYGTVSDSVYGNVNYIPNQNFNGIDSFEYTISDGNGKTDTATVTITINSANDAPVANDDSATTLVNTEVSKTIIATDADQDILTYSISTDPNNGTVNINASTGKWTYTPNTGFSETDSYMINIDDGYGGTAIVTININVIKGNIKLRGNITDKEDNKSVANATVTLYDLDDNYIKHDVTDEDGDYLVEDIIENVYKIVVTHDEYSKNQRMVNISSTNEDLKNGEIVEDFKLVNFTIDLTANPNSIVGDGNSKSLLTAKLIDKNGIPIKDVEVLFNAEKGKFSNDSTNISAITDEDGNASVEYTSAKIEGIVSQVIPITAIVEDEAKGLFDFAQIQITFEPSSIKGVVVDQKTLEPVEGAKVEITKDFNEDDIVDFYGMHITGIDGVYKIAVPKGNESYDINITVPKTIGEETVEITYNQKGNVSGITGTGNEDFDATKTATGLILSQDTSGNQRMLDKEDYKKMKLELSDENGIIVGEGVITEQGIFEAKDLQKDKEYEFKIIFELDDGIEIVIGKLNVEINNDGEVQISEVLIDPYGTITDSTNGNIIVGAKVDLYYADTQRNKDDGKTPHTIVDLPEVDNFPPADNLPHSSDENGKYAYMVFPETDYYLVAIKEGYEQYISPTIPVEFEIVRHDISMNPINNNSSSTRGSKSGVDMDVAIVLEAESIKVEENNIATVVVNYYNKTSADLKNLDIEFEIPDGVSVFDSGEGVISGNIIKWSIQQLKKDSKGQIIVKTKVKPMDVGEDILIFEANITSKDKLINKEDDYSKIMLFAYSNKFDNLHKRYIKGYPDGEFKPNKNITRAEIAAIFARILELESIVTNEQIYTDVSVNHWASEYIEAVTIKDLFKGYENNQFKPESPITRAELATVIARYLEISREGGEPINNHFSDTANHWAQINIEEIYRYKIINGYEDGTFKPNQYMIRTEAVVMVSRMLHGGPLKNVEQTFPDMPNEHWAYGYIQEAVNTHKSTINNDGSESMVKFIKEPLW